MTSDRNISNSKESEVTTYKNVYKVYIVGADRAITDMWRNRGHIISSFQEDADIVQFIGGADIDPSLYGEKVIRGTHSVPFQDKRDQEAWNKIRPKQMRVGICRGGQFLNVMNGGEMFQHVDNHAVYEGHAIEDLLITRDKIWVSSTHHQMMVPSIDGEIIAFATIAKGHRSDKTRKTPRVDTEVVWYSKTRSLCFQPHPELSQFEECQDYYFNLIEKLI